MNTHPDLLQQALDAIKRLLEAFDVEERPNCICIQCCSIRDARSTVAAIEAAQAQPVYELAKELAALGKETLLESLRHIHIGDEIWEDIADALKTAKDEHHGPDLDELDCELLLGLLALYRRGLVVPPSQPQTSQPSPAVELPVVAQKFWLWRNFVDGRPEYWAFDNPYPINLQDCDPHTLGEPCGYAIFKPSRNGRPDMSEAQVLAAIAAAQEAKP